jgi:hypothetical protein
MCLIVHDVVQKFKFLSALWIEEQKRIVRLIFLPSNFSNYMKICEKIRALGVLINRYHVNVVIWYNGVAIFVVATVYSFVSESFREFPF